jgi:hypothetical protein
MAYDFVKASSQYLSVAHTTALNTPSSITFAGFVFRGSDLTTSQHVAAKYLGTGNQRGWLLTIDTAGKVFVIISSNGSLTTDRLSSAAISAEWTHVAFTFTGSTAQPNIYLNGSLSNGAASTGLTGIFNNTADLTFGINSNKTGNPFGGKLAEVGIYNAALTAAEIASLAKGMTPDKIRPQNLVFYAPLVRDLIDQKGGLTITNNNAATVANHPRVYA